MSNLLVQNIKHTNGTTAQTVDSGGRVTTPARPVFCAIRATHQTSAGVGAFDVAIVNVGSHYSTSTYRFTAPVAGTYWFTCTGLPYTTSSGDFFYFRKNGTHYGDGIGGGAAFKTYLVNADESITNSLPITLAASDYVDTYFVANGTEANYSHFSGYLLG